MMKAPRYEHSYNIENILFDLYQQFSIVYPLRAHRKSLMNYKFQTYIQIYWYIFDTIIIVANDTILFLRLFIKRIHCLRYLKHYHF